MTEREPDSEHDNRPDQRHSGQQNDDVVNVLEPHLFISWMERARNNRAGDTRNSRIRRSVPGRDTKLSVHEQEERQRQNQRGKRRRHRQRQVPDHSREH